MPEQADAYVGTAVGVLVIAVTEVCRFFFGWMVVVTVVLATEFDVEVVY